MKDDFNIKATGKNIELGSFFQKYNLKKLSSVFLKYSANPISANTVLEKRNVFFKVKLDILIDNNIKFETLGRSKIATLALDEAVENISKRLRRHYRKIKNHRLLNNGIDNVKKDLVRFHLNS
jgi:ribosomal subunit interface protein